MYKPVVAFDLDDVLKPFNDSFIRHHNKYYGTNVEFDDITTYEIEKVCGCDITTMRERLFAFSTSDGHDLINPLSGAQENVRALAKEYTLHIVTGRPELIRDRTEAWVEKFFPNHFQAIHFTNGFISNDQYRRQCKSAVCKRIGAQVLIDDALVHALPVAECGIPVLLPDKPWNRDALPQNVLRTHTWDDVRYWIEIVV